MQIAKTSQAQITIEEAAEQFKQWRQNKTNKFASTPANLKTLILQLIPCHSQQQIVKYLKISPALIKSLITQDYNSSQNINFIPFQINHNTTAINHKQEQSICHIIKPDGIKLVVQTSDPKSIIRAFLCSN